MITVVIPSDISVVIKELVSKKELAFIGKTNKGKLRRLDTRWTIRPYEWYTSVSGNVGKKERVKNSDVYDIHGQYYDQYKLITRSSDNALKGK